LNAEEFEAVYDQMSTMSRWTLVEKAKEYASDGDRLHNFKIAAALTQSSEEQALWGFLVKHLVSLSDMVTSGDEYTDAQWDEKIGDAINYLFLLRAQVQETKSNRTALDVKIPTPPVTNTFTPTYHNPT
jgi:hypothetical protein